MIRILFFLSCCLFFLNLECNKSYLILVLCSLQLVKVRMTVPGVSEILFPLPCSMMLRFFFFKKRTCLVCAIQMDDRTLEKVDICGRYIRFVDLPPDIDVGHALSKMAVCTFFWVGGGVFPYPPSSPKKWLPKKTCP